MGSGGKQEHPTINTQMVFRCLLVGLDDGAAQACKGAVRPLEAVIVGSVREACTRMSEVLPLIVVHHPDAANSEMAELVELAEACGAELIAVAQPPDPSALGHQILEALRKGEARRVGR